MNDKKIMVWCLLGRKVGDNTQVRALAQALGYPVTEKSIKARPWEILSHLGSGATLAGVDRGGSSVLRAPWPDLVITAGRRNEPVARWIQRQSDKKVRLVHIGRPWAALDNWDLVVTTPQYFLPRQANIVHNSLPLHGATVVDASAAIARLRPQLMHLPRPRITVLVGGNSGSFVMTPSKGRRLGRLIHDLATACGGSLLVTDSARTPPAAGAALRAQLPAAHIYYRWGSEQDNPYHAFLALADAVVVTGESMSMLSEAQHTGRPLYIFDLADEDARWWRRSYNYRIKPITTRVAMHLAALRMRRDVGNIQNALVASHRAQWLTHAGITAAAALLQAGVDQADTDKKSSGLSIAEQDLQRAVQAVRRLVSSR